jgi:hypothetical protein
MARRLRGGTLLETGTTGVTRSGSMDGLVRLWSMTALEAARRSEQARTKPAQAQPQLPATLGKAGAWARWMPRRAATTEPAPMGLTSPGGAGA